MLCVSNRRFNEIRSSKEWIQLVLHVLELQECLVELRLRVATALASKLGAQIGCQPYPPAPVGRYGDAARRCLVVSALEEVLVLVIDQDLLAHVVLDHVSEAGDRLSDHGDEYRWHGYLGKRHWR